MTNLNLDTEFPFYEPRVALTDEIKKALIEADNSSSAGKKLSNDTYANRIKAIFKLKPVSDSISEDQKYFLAGFIEGEGSINISVKKNSNAKFGITLDAEFSITQHVNGVSLLYLALNLFKTGRIKYKHGSLATLSFIISNRESLNEKVLPFFYKFVIPYGSNAKSKRLALFTEFLKKFEEKKHLDLESLQNQILPIWDAMRIQKGQKNETFPDLESAQKYVREFKKT